jgi:hypothetical protein
MSLFIILYLYTKQIQMTTLFKKVTSLNLRVMILVTTIKNLIKDLMKSPVGLSS